MYKSSIATVLILLTGWITLSAQNQPERFQQINAHKVAYLTDKMDLSVEEAEKFWPMYNEYQKSLTTIRREARIAPRHSTDEEAKSILYGTLEKNEQEIALKREFYEKASQAISYKKLLLMEKGERDFRIEILERFQNMRKRK